MLQGGKKTHKSGPSERHPILLTAPLTVLEAALTYLCNVLSNHFDLFDLFQTLQRVS